MKINKKPTMLMILDGFGLNPDSFGNAIKQANTPNIDRIFSTYPSTELSASGPNVGLPEKQMGNSEVGHLNIGAGRIVYQDFSKITKAIRDKTFFDNPKIKAVMNHVTKHNSTLHLQGLLSDGGVHSHISHLFALIDMAKLEGIKSLVIHCFLDGRDVPPRCAKEYLTALENKLRETGIGKIGTISGRYYAMDRDNRWERICKAYDVMTTNTAGINKSTDSVIEDSYKKDISDEFLLPVMVNDNCTVNDNDGIVMYNFRPDRAREITRAFVDRDFSGFDRKKILKNLFYVCMTQYDKLMPGVSVAYPPENYKNTFGEYISLLRLNQLRIAETEKYAHVTFFFNGGVEEPNPGEDRILIPSPKVATYDMKPEMSAFEVTDSVLEEINKDKYDFIILNFANADMVGHTGNMQAAVKAIEALDTCIEKIESAILKIGGQIFLTADHGNADTMIDHDCKTITAHSLNPVPLVHISDTPENFKSEGSLCDIAPTILASLGIEIPGEMTGKNLLL